MRLWVMCVLMMVCPGGQTTTYLPVLPEGQCPISMSYANDMSYVHNAHACDTIV